ncbi:DoxX family protein [Paenibacillus sp. NPDC056579]|uniref:DoxX family protein n=1 Tax=unclassified Paenibacillus TaxID=185978 RepID=UPI001EF83258|nr:DoxX family protein [Paenibacillus sp. H1-7]ULL13723.1 DoxX family protein [Paenibacillus sp. H1-7]
MKKTVVFYYVCTVLLSLVMGVGSIPNIMSAPEAVVLFEHLGYPAYLLPFLGVAKLLGVIAIWIPGFPRIKEWAYAGLAFDMAGAMYSIIAVGDPASGYLTFIIFFAILAGSYICHHRLAAFKSQAKKHSEGNRMNAESIQSV